MGLAIIKSRDTRFKGYLTYMSPTENPVPGPNNETIYQVHGQPSL